MIIFGDLSEKHSGTTSFQDGHPAFLMHALILLSREQREKEEIEKYRMERPKIQQQFSDLKVSRGQHAVGRAPCPRGRESPALRSSGGAPRALC